MVKNIVELKEYKITPNRSKELFFKECKNKSMSLNEFFEKSNYFIFGENSKTIEKTKKAYSDKLNLNVVKLIAYIKNLNNSHKVFYNGFKLALNYDETINNDDLLKEDKVFKHFVDLKINSIFFEYRKEKDKNLTTIE